MTIQFYRPHENIAMIDNSKDFLIQENAPERIVTLFKESCYDCHSNHTTYLWYDNIAPLSWYVDGIIQKAKFSLNFSKWGDLEPWRRRLFLQGAIPYDIEIRKMPPENYLLLHEDSHISTHDAQRIQKWINTLRCTAALARRIMLYEGIHICGCPQLPPWLFMYVRTLPVTRHPPAPETG